MFTVIEKWNRNTLIILTVISCILAAVDTRLVIVRTKQMKFYRGMYEGIKAEIIVRDNTITTQDSEIYKLLNIRKNLRAQLRAARKTKTTYIPRDVETQPEIKYIYIDKPVTKIEDITKTDDEKINKELIESIRKLLYTQTSKWSSPFTVTPEEITAGISYKITRDRKLSVGISGSSRGTAGVNLIREW